MLDIVLKIWAPLRKLVAPRCPKLVTGLLPAKKIPHESTSSIRLFEIVFRWSCIWVYEKVVDYFLSSFSSFCWIGVSSSIIIIVNCRQLSLNWTWTIHNYVCGAHISLECEPHFSKFSLTLKCFLRFVYQKCFFFIYYLISIFERFLQLIHYFRITYGKNISSG